LHAGFLRIEAGETCASPVYRGGVRQASIGAESVRLQVIAPIDVTERSISSAKQSRRDEERAIVREAILDLQTSSRSSWLSFHRSRESIRNVCDAVFRVDASGRRAICPAIRRGLAYL